LDGFQDEDDANMDGKVSSLAIWLV
jgi:hypothetical protein